VEGEVGLSCERRYRREMGKLREVVGVLRAIILPAAILLSIATAWAGGGDSQRMATLYTTNPGPYALLVNWCGGDNRFVEIGSQTYRANSYGPSDWGVINLPESVTPLDFPLHWPATNEVRPVFVLNALGDRMRLLVDRKGIRPHQLTVQNSEPASGHTAAMNLPPANAGIYHLQLSMLEDRTESINIRIRIDEAEAMVAIGGGVSSAEVLVEVEGSGAKPVPLTICTSNGQKLPKMTVLVQPLFERLECRPFQAGVYSYRVFNPQKMKYENPITRHLVAGRTASLSRDGCLVGECLRFVPAYRRVKSDLSNDEIFSFDGFHGGGQHSSPRWTSSALASVSINVPDNCAAEIMIGFQDVYPESIRPVDARLQIEGSSIPISFMNGDTVQKIRIPPRARPQDKVDISIRSDTWCPAEAMGSADRRTLGVLLSSLSVRYLPVFSTGGDTADQVGEP
jgi:hypothetical protein